MTTSRFRKLFVPGVASLLVMGGMGASSFGRVATAAASTRSSCFPAMDATVGSGYTGDFTASTMGSGFGNVAIETPTTQFEGPGRTTWSAQQTVTGNTGSPGGTMSGYLNLSVVQGSHSVSFTSSCILEAGVFAGESEDDPFDPEDNHIALRGIEGEWIGTAYNYPVPGQSTQVVASLAVWTTSVGPRFHLDITTASFTPGLCPNESDTGGSVSAGGPTQPTGNNIVVNAPNQQSGFGSCTA